MVSEDVKSKRIDWSPVYNSWIPHVQGPVGWKTEVVKSVPTGPFDLEDWTSQPVKDTTLVRVGPVIVFGGHTPVTDTSTLLQIGTRGLSTTLGRGCSVTRLRTRTEE